MSRRKAIFSPAQFRRDKVLKRLKLAADKFWGIEKDGTQALDPVLEMLLGACAVEFEKTGDYINNAQKRVLEKLSEILVPEVYTNARPAHGIACLSVEKDYSELAATNQFLLKVIEGEEDRSIVLSPITYQKILNAEVSSQFFGNRLVYYDAPTRKSREFVAVNHRPELWLGLSIDSKVTSLEGLSFYFYFRDNTNSSDALRLIHSADWYHNGVPIKVTNGLSNNDTYETGIQSSEDEFEAEVCHFYNDHFSVITGKNNSELVRQNYPPFFQEIFGEEQLDEMTDPLCWIQIQFDTINIPRDMDEVFCAVNCAPVINRKLESNNRPYSLSSKLNMIPLLSEGHILSVNKVFSSHRNFRNHTLQELQNNEIDGTYSLRRGGSFRFDERDASLVLVQLYNLLRDESAAFNALGHRALSAEIKSLDQNLERLRIHFIDKIQELNSRCNLIVHAHKKEDVWVEFWSTLGLAGNGVHRGKRLQVLSGDKLKKEGAFLLTNLIGGTDVMDEAGKIHAFKNVLLTRNRVVTHEDIRSACFAVLGKRIKEVQITKGFKASPDAKIGFKKTINVKIVPADNANGINWEVECLLLKTHIERRKVFLSEIEVGVLDNTLVQA